MLARAYYAGGPTLVTSAIWYLGGWFWREEWRHWATSVVTEYLPKKAANPATDVMSCATMVSMERALFNKTFHATMRPQAKPLETLIRFQRQGARGGCFGDVWLGSNGLSVEDINRQLPEMPNNLRNDANVLHYEETRGDGPGERDLYMGGYVTTTLCCRPPKVVGCLRFSLHLSHRPQKRELIGCVELDGVCVHPRYRRRRIASTLGVLVGEYLVEKLSDAYALLMPKTGSVILSADFNHEGGEACFDQVVYAVEELGAEAFPLLTVVVDAGW